MPAPTDSENPSPQKHSRPPPASAATFPSGSTITVYSKSPDAAVPEQEQLSVAFVKGGKRKRLSKACDACHKSKRRCDGTAPCSNCYYASKNCTYTDAAGRPVPAPRNTHPIKPADVATAQPAADTPPWAGQATLASPPVNPQGGVERDPTTKRYRKGPSAPEPSPPSASKGVTSSEIFTQAPDPAVTHELVNIFFAHCNPQRMIIHKPSFSADLALSKVPTHLILAVCAVAAPLSKSIASKASHSRLAGVPFFQDSLKLMFDNSGRLLCEPTVSTAQALCLLEMHEIAASHSWTRHFRYFELALQVLEGSLEVHRPDNSAPPSPADPGALMDFIDRECTRRCFWLIQLMAWVSNIYTHREVRPRMVELADIVRLPIDETTFELTSVTSSATSEYLRRPAPRTRYASQFGHMLRIMEIYHNVEVALTTKEGPARVADMPGLRKRLEEWHASLPSHLQYTEDNMETQVTMFETSANSGAWCYCFMHAMYPCCYLAVKEGEGTLTEPIPWVRNQLNMILTAAGTRAKTSILSACALWSYSKYSPDDPQVQVWDRDFEKLWGFKVVVVAEQWRQSQAKAKEQALTSQQQKAYHQVHDTPSSQSSSSSPASSHSSPGVVTLQAQPYEGRRENGDTRALLRTTDLDSRLAVVGAGAGAPRTSLPSLEQAGLLDSLNMKAPYEAFASTLSLGSQSQGGPWDTSSGAGPPRGQQQTPGSAASMPVGLNWLVDAAGGGRA